jgi:hypothetical protein
MYLHEHAVKALQGKLTSPETKTGSALSVKVVNKLAVPVCVVYVDSKGHQDLSTLCTLKPNEDKTYDPTNKKYPVSLYSGDFLLVTTSYTGAFVCVLEIKPEATNLTCCEERIHAGKLATPNDIGPVPEPTTFILIPPDSPRVLVGCGKAKHDARLLREQYWHRHPDSFSLPPNEKRTISLTTVAGRQATSSTEKDIEKSLDAGTDVGWGPISVSLSAGLSSSTTDFQQVTITEQSTAYVSFGLHNQTLETQIILSWQLIDIVTVFDAAGEAKGTVSQAINPVLTKTYPPSPIQQETRPRVLGAPPDPPLVPDREREDDWVASSPR